MAQSPFMTFTMGFTHNLLRHFSCSTKRLKSGRKFGSKHKYLLYEIKQLSTPIDADPSLGVSNYGDVTSVD